MGAGELHNDDPSDHAPLLAATAGVGFTLRPRPNTQICPFISVEVTGETASRATVMIQGREYDIRGIATQSYALGASVGAALSSVTAFDVVPFVSAAVIARNTDIYLGADGPTEAEQLLTSPPDRSFPAAFGTPPVRGKGCAHPLIRLIAHALFGPIARTPAITKEAPRVIAIQPFPPRSS